MTNNRMRGERGKDKAPRKPRKTVENYSSRNLKSPLVNKRGLTEYAWLSEGILEWVKTNSSTPNGLAKKIEVTSSTIFRLIRNPPRTLNEKILKKFEAVGIAAPPDAPKARERTMQQDWQDYLENLAHAPLTTLIDKWYSLGYLASEWETLTGLSYDTLYAYRAGTRGITFQSTEKICKGLRITPLKITECQWLKDYVQPINKKCPTCGEMDIEKFGKDKSRADGLTNACLKCRNARMKNRYKNDPDYFKDRVKQRRARYQNDQ